MDLVGGQTLAPDEGGGLIDFGGDSAAWRASHRLSPKGIGTCKTEAVIFMYQWDREQNCRKEKMKFQVVHVMRKGYTLEADPAIGKPQTVGDGLLATGIVVHEKLKAPEIWGVQYLTAATAH